MTCVLKPAARTSSGIQSPANAASGFVPKCRIHQVEPNDVWANFAHRSQDAQGIAHAPHAPTAADLKARQFGAIRLLRRILVTKNCEIDILTAKLIGEMKAVFAEMVPAGRERCDEANSHISPCRRKSLAGHPGLERFKVINEILVEHSLTSMRNLKITLAVHPLRCVEKLGGLFANAEFRKRYFIISTACSLCTASPRLIVMKLRRSPDRNRPAAQLAWMPVLSESLSKTKTGSSNDWSVIKQRL